MNQNVLNEVYKGTSKFLRCNAATILSIVAVGGVVGTAVSVSKATSKASEKLKEATDDKKEPLNNVEIIAAVGPIFIPSILIGGTTIACILGANILNKHSQAALASAYGLADQTFKEYRKKLIELHGEEMDEEIRAEIARNHYDYHVHGINCPDQKVTWYDPYSERFFEMYERELIDAEYHFNRNFTIGGSRSLNDLYDMLGLPYTRKGEKLGWCVCDGYCWVDFEHVLQRNKDGSEYYILQPIFPPMTEDEMEECGYCL